MSWHAEIDRPAYYVGMRFIDAQERIFEIVETWWDDRSGATFYCTWTTPEGYKVNIIGDQQRATLRSVAILEIGKDRSEIFHRSVKKMKYFEEQKLIAFY